MNTFSSHSSDSDNKRAFKRYSRRLERRIAGEKEAIMYEIEKLREELNEAKLSGNINRMEELSQRIDVFEEEQPHDNAPS